MKVVNLVRKLQVLLVFVLDIIFRDYMSLFTFNIEL
jgi:hypothetical protein